MADLGDFGFGPDATDVLTPDSGKGNNIFGKKDPIDYFTVSSLSQELEQENKNVIETGKVEDKPLDPNIQAAGNILSAEIEKFDKLDVEEAGEEEIIEETGTTTKTGRPKTEKSALTEVLLNKFTDKTFEVVFDDKKDDESVEQYLNRLPVKDLTELLDANIKKREEDILSKAPDEIFQNLPEEFQYAIDYYTKGGRDHKALFRALAHVEESRALNPEDETDAVQISRNFLQSTGWSSEDIESQISEWKEYGKLEEKAKGFKPKLDQMQEQQVQYQIQQQQEYNRMQEEAATAYITNVKQAVKDNDLGGIKVDKKLISNIEYGLTNLQWPSAAGQPTNILGHLLDKIQYVEPDFKLLTKVTAYLMDPQGFENLIRQQGKNEQVEKVTKILQDGQVKREGTSLGYQEEQPVVKKVLKARNVLKMN